jgi:large subunit ribosomal protein L32
VGAVPKSKISRHRRGNRRRHQFLTAPVLVTCPNCGSKMRAHRVCKDCGTYKGRMVIRPKDEQID